MNMNESNLDKVASLTFDCKYSVVEIAKSNSKNAYGIAAKDASEVDMCIKEIGYDKELALSILCVLNNYRVPFVHFLDVISDLMNE